jgi:hypothetical protein
MPADLPHEATIEHVFQSAATLWAIGYEGWSPEAAYELLRHGRRGDGLGGGNMDVCDWRRCALWVAKDLGASCEELGVFTRRSVPGIHGEVNQVRYKLPPYQPHPSVGSRIRSKVAKIQLAMLDFNISVEP